MFDFEVTKSCFEIQMLGKFLIIAFTKSCENLHFTKFETTSIKGHISNMFPIPIFSCNKLLQNWIQLANL